MANNENLLKGNPETEFSSGRRAVEEGKKGGDAKAKNVKETKLFKEAISDILDLPATDQMLIMIQQAFHIGKGVKLTLKEAMVYAQTLKAINEKDTQAFTALVDRVDGKPKQITELTGKDGKDLTPPVINLIPAILKDKKD